MSNSTTTLQLLKRSNSNFNAEIEKIVSGLTSQTLSLVDIVTSLEAYFCSSELDAREEGIAILSIILERLTLTSLNHNEVVQFCSFYKAKLHDHSKLLPSVLNGILSLSQYDLPMETCCFSELLTTLFQNVSCQAQKFSERLIIYKIFMNLLRNQAHELLSLGPDLVYGVISAIDGERDPGNLLFLFKWIPEFINTVKLGHLCEEMHECLACYFPVDFRVPAQQANGISRDELAEALKHCLCASSEFSDFTMQLAFEKLSSDLQIAKCDSLQLLLLGCKKFDTDIYLKYQAGTWLYLQKELLGSPSPELEHLLLTTITAVCQKLSTDPTNFVEICDNILETNVNNLNSQEKFFVPTCKLFLAMSKANQFCAQRILNDVQPRLINLYNITSTKDNKQLIFRTLNEFIKIGNNFNANVQGIPCFVMTNLLETDPKIQSLALEALCYINNQFNEIKQSVIQQWGKLLSQDISEEVREAFHNCLFHYNESCRTEIIAIIDNFGLDKFNIVMLHLCYLSSHQIFSEQFAKYLVKFYDLHRQICLKMLNMSLTLHRNNGSFFKAIETSNVINEKVMNPVLVPTETDELQYAREILMKIMANYSREQQAIFIGRHLPTFINSFNSDVTTSLYYLSGIMTNLHIANLEENCLLNRLFDISCAGNAIATELLANLINKLPEDIIFKHLSNFEAFLKEFDDKNLDNMGKVVIWLTKAVYMRGLQSKHIWMELLMEYLPKTETIPAGIKLIMSDNCPSLSPESFAIRKLLYKQQFFSEMCQKLKDSFTVDNKHCIVAFAFLISEVPNVILRMNIEQLLQMVFLCLDNSTEAVGIIPILETVKTLIESKDNLSAIYADEFLPRLITLSRFQGCMRVRILALQCLRFYTNGSVPVHKLLLYQSEVTHSLGRCVDDKKRLVRKEAADARLQWFLLNSSEDKENL